MSRRTMIRPIGLPLGLAALIVLGAVTGCMRHPEPPASSAQNLTVGTVQREIRVGMPASEVAAVLGSPNIVTTDAQRREEWIYDKVSTESVQTSNSVGGGILILGGRTAQGQTSRTQRTLTIIIKFDDQNMVRDFAYNYSQF